VEHVKGNMSWNFTPKTAEILLETLRFSWDDNIKRDLSHKINLKKDKVVMCIINETPLPEDV
jgi:hypothetical protein